MLVTGLEVETRAARAGELPHIVGYAAVFDSPAVIRGLFGSFTEIIRSGAFAKTIGRDDIRALFNHDDNFVLGRSVPGQERNTLRLEEDRHGLKMDITPPDTQSGRDVVEWVRRGDVTGASFGFTVPPGGQRWVTDETGEPVQRELLEVNLMDVSPVTFPAYPDTEVSSRAAAWARRAMAGGQLTDEELAIVRRMLPAWANQGTTAPGGASPSVQGPPEPDASLNEYRRKLEALEAELRGGRT